MSKTWLITGADKGLGLSTARTALEQGDRVVVTVLAKDGGHVLLDEFPETLRAIHLDMRDHDRIPAVVAEAEAAFGGIDVLVNNAGYGLLALVEETTPEQYRPLFEVLFFGLAEMTRAVLPGMRAKRRGHIVNLSSVGGFGAGAGFGFYGAAKFAVEGLSEALSAEVRDLGIHVTIVEPGGFRSDFAGSSLASAAVKNADYAAIAKYIDDYSATRHGNQLNDPAMFGPAICRLVAVENPPLRLPLGTDAVKFIRDQLQQVAGDVDAWEDLSAITSVPAHA